MPKEVMEKMRLKHIKGIIFCGITFDIYKDKETGHAYLKIEGENGGDMVFVELKNVEEGGEKEWLIE